MVLMWFLMRREMASSSSSIDFGYYRYAKRFKMNQFTALAIGFALVYPNIAA